MDKPILSETSTKALVTGEKILYNQIRNTNGSHYPGQEDDFSFYKYNVTLLSENAVKELRQVARSILEFDDATLIELVLDSKCMFSEAIGLKVEDIDFESNCMLTNQNWCRHFSNSCGQNLYNLIKGKPQCGPVFTDSTGQRKSPSSIKKIISILSDNTSINLNGFTLNTVITTGMRKYRHYLAEQMIVCGDIELRSFNSLH